MPNHISLYYWLKRIISLRIPENKENQFVVMKDQDGNNISIYFSSREKAEVYFSFMSMIVKDENPEALILRED